MKLTKDSTYTLSNGVEIPMVGFGTWQTPDGAVAKQAVLDALAAGYRHIDTAAVYKNEESVGHGIAESGIPREEIFVTTKLWNTVHTYDAAKEALATSLSKLGLDYLDLYLIHFPSPLEIRDNWEARNKEVWRYMEDALEQGLVRSIGISNFHERHIEALLKTAKIIPHANQICSSPSDYQPEIVEVNNKYNILTQAYSPLGTGTLTELPELQIIAEKYGKTPSHLALRWSLQKGFNPLPKSVTSSRIVANLDLFDFELTDEDMKAIDGLVGTGKTSDNPDELPF